MKLPLYCCQPRTPSLVLWISHELIFLSVHCWRVSAFSFCPFTLRSGQPFLFCWQQHQLPNARLQKKSSHVQPHPSHHSHSTLKLDPSIATITRDFTGYSSRLRLQFDYRSHRKGHSVAKPLPRRVGRATLRSRNPSPSPAHPPHPHPLTSARKRGQFRICLSAAASVASASKITPRTQAAASAASVPTTIILHLVRPTTLDLVLAHAPFRLTFLCRVISLCLSARQAFINQQHPALADMMSPTTSLRTILHARVRIDKYQYWRWPLWRFFRRWLWQQYRWYDMRRFLEQSECDVSAVRPGAQTAEQHAAGLRQRHPTSLT